MPSLNPIRDARPKFGEDPEATAAAETGDDQEYRPRIGKRGTAEERRTHHVDSREQRIKRQRVHPDSKRLGWPKDRRNEEYHLHKARHDGWNVAIARANHA